MSNRREFSVLNLNKNFVFTGNYSSSTIYQKNEVVIFNGQMWLYFNEAPLANIEPNIVNVTSWQSIDGNSKVLSGILTARPIAINSNSGRTYYATDTQELYLSSGSSWTTIARVAPASNTVPGLVRVFNNNVNPVVYRTETTDTLLSGKANIGANTDITSLSSTTDITSTNITSTNLTLTTGNLNSTPSTADPGTRIINKAFSDARALAFVNSNMRFTNDFYLGVSPDFHTSNAVNINSASAWWNVNVDNFNGTLTNFSSDLTGRISLWDTASNSWVIRTSGRIEQSFSAVNTASLISDVFAQWNGTIVTLSIVERSSGNGIFNYTTPAAITLMDGIWCRTGAKNDRYIGSVCTTNRIINGSHRIFNNNNRKLIVLEGTGGVNDNPGYAADTWHYAGKETDFLGTPISSYSPLIVDCRITQLSAIINGTGFYTIFSGIARYNQNTVWTIDRQLSSIHFTNPGIRITLPPVSFNIAAHQGLNYFTTGLFIGGIGATLGTVGSTLSIFRQG